MEVEFFYLYLTLENQYKQKYYEFFCPFINNKTTIKDVIKIFSTLFLEEKICQCFNIYRIEKNTIPVTNMNESINNYFFYNNNSKPYTKLYIYKKENCKCDEDYKKSKQEIIKNYKVKIKEYEDYINNLNYINDAPKKIKMI